jgi:hypothetical protein
MSLATTKADVYKMQEKNIPFTQRMFLQVQKYGYSKYFPPTVNIPSVSYKTALFL